MLPASLGSRSACGLPDIWGTLETVLADAAVTAWLPASGLTEVGKSACTEAVKHKAMGIAINLNENFFITMKLRDLLIDCLSENAAVRTIGGVVDRKAHTERSNGPVSTDSLRIADIFSSNKTCFYVLLK